MVSASLKILVVEDEPLIRIGMVTMLEETGFQTYEAANADAAIEILKDRQNIRLVVTDVDMPGTMDGVKLAHFVRTRWPPIQLIVISGNIGDLTSQLPTGVRFFGKPYQERNFMQVVGEMMGRDGGAAS